MLSLTVTMLNGERNKGVDGKVFFFVPDSSVDGMCCKHVYTQYLSFFIECYDSVVVVDVVDNVQCPART